jgi:hypothetical protein
MAVVLAVLHQVADALSVLITALVGAYWIPGLPVRAAVDEWIQRRVSLQFEKEMATFRHRLDLDAEAVRADHQRLLHNAALVTEKKHEVYRELFRLAHVANGYFGAFYGGQRMRIFDGYTREQLGEYLDTLRLPGEHKQAILGRWEVDRPQAERDIRAAQRAANLGAAEHATTEAWNYFVLNQLYLTDAATTAAAAVLRKVQSLVPVVQYPNERADIAQLHGEATELMEHLRQLLRAELGVVQPGPAVPGPQE